MKKYQRVNLASNIYRLNTTNTPDRSPPSPCNTNYKNICCPNCKYLFRVPKQNSRLANMDEPHHGHRNGASFRDRENDRKSPRITKKDLELRSVKVQTEQYLMGEFRTGAKLELGARAAMTDRTPERRKDKSFNIIDKEKMSYTDRFREGLLRTEMKKLGTSPRVSPRASDRIEGLFSKTSKSKQYPTRMAYVNENVSRNKRAETTVDKGKTVLSSAIKQSEQNQQVITRNINKEVPQGKRQKSESMNRDYIQQKLTEELMSKITLAEEISELIEYQLSLPPETAIPSYCKMLLYELKDKQKQEKGKSTAKEIDRSPLKPAKNSSSLGYSGFFDQNSGIKYDQYSNY